MTAWGCLWRSKNNVDGVQQYLLWNGPVPFVRRTCREMRAEIEKQYGYIRVRPDLRQEPHGWQMPLAVKVRVSVVEILGNIYEQPELLKAQP